MTLDTHLADLLSAPVLDRRAVAGGDICQAWRVEIGGGRTVFAKTHPSPPRGFFSAEARGLRWLGEPARVAVPEVIAVSDRVLVLEWVAPGRPTPSAAEGLGRALGGTHAAGAQKFGRVGGDGFIGALPLPNTPPGATWAEFYAECRIQPFLQAARDRGAISPPDQRAVESVLDQLPAIAGAPEPPARIHGDLWAGNLLWGSDGVVRLIDAASAHGGHRETDLAMLTLFGAPHLDRILAAYQDTYPLSPGWRERVPLHQLHPVLVHAALFGGHYGHQAGRLARSCLG